MNLLYEGTKAFHFDKLNIGSHVKRTTDSMRHFYPFNLERCVSNFPRLARLSRNENVGLQYSFTYEEMMVNAKKCF